MGTIILDHVEIDIEDLFHSTYDRKRIFKFLKDEGYVPDEMVIDDDGTLQLPHEKNIVQNLSYALSVLDKNGWKLTKEETDTILKIAEKYKYF
jgi:hypothetical protein